MTLHLHHPYRGGLDSVSINMDLAEEDRQLAGTFGDHHAREPQDIYIIRRNGRWVWDVFFGDCGRDARGSTETFETAIYCVQLVRRGIEPR